MNRNKRKPVYIISIAAKLTNVHPQTLRLYERKKLVIPIRTSTNIRLYSEENIEKTIYIQGLTQNLGINLAGVGRILDLERELELAELDLKKAQIELERLTKEMEREIEDVRKSFKHEIVPFSSREIEPI